MKISKVEAYRIYIASLLGIVLLTLAVPVVAQFGDVDLVVKGVELTPKQPAPGDTVKILVVITNQGRGDATEGFDVQVRLDGRLIYFERLVFGLRAKEERKLQALWQNATEGTHMLSVEVDPFNEVRESDERNNKLEKTFTVKKLVGVQSLSDEMFLVIGRALKESGKALNVNDQEQDLLKVFNEVVEGFERASAAFTNAAQELQNLRSSLPDSLAQASQIFSNDLIELYKSLADSLGKASKSIGLLNFTKVIEDLAGLEQNLKRLAVFDFDGFRLSGLDEAIVRLNEAIQTTKLLSDILAGKKSGDIEKTARELSRLLKLFGENLSKAGAQAEEIATKSPVSFSDASGNPVTNYRAGEALIISARGAQRLKLEVFAQNTLVFNNEIEGERLEWRGTYSSGKPLAAGIYFYKLTFKTTEGERVNIGQIVIS